MFLRKFILFLLFVNSVAYSQENLTAFSISDDLKENANSVVRLNEVDVNISSRRSMTVKTHRIITILNEYGARDIDASEYFDKSTRIKSIEAVVYNAAGKEIKKIRKKDFREQSVSEGSIITDNRVLYLDYTPVQYPFTVEYISETETSNTAFIPPWIPLEGLYISTQKSVMNITYDASVGFKYKPYNFAEGDFTKQETVNTLKLTAENIPARRAEDYSPSFLQLMPHVMFGVDKFYLEGVEGEAANWQSFGAWMYNNLLNGTDELPEETVAKIKSLTASAATPLEKAKLVYEYMQYKTRYISIQLGIGGWKPMLAKDVDRLGYGDCKALTNYTRSLLKAAGVDSYYAVVYGDSRGRDIREDFVCMQGNHVILAVPNGNDFVWLECTSQKLPFGFQGDFTDDRAVLLVHPEKSRIVQTHKYLVKDNTQIGKGNYKLSESGAISGNVSFTSSGLQYDDKYYLESASPDDIDKRYKNLFGHINNLKLTDTKLKNHADKQQFTEDIALEAEGYGNKSGNRIIFAVNAFNQSSHVPQRYRNRQNPLVIETGYLDADEITIELPEGFKIEAKPDNIDFKEKFGEYKAEYIMVSDNKMLYKRSLSINQGSYESADYENYRQFRDKVARNDNAKVVLVKN